MGPSQSESNSGHAGNDAAQHGRSQDEQLAIARRIALETLEEDHQTLERDAKFAFRAAGT